MDYKTHEKKLHNEGFLKTYVWTDAPGTHYAGHTHHTITAHIILAGEMELIIEGKKHLLKAGDRFDVPVNAVHSARIG
ncbi:MAG: cupin domain-containing protein, partial [Candidatus Sungbacteria bacterium]|nr:cupin domain-containing protein [Candidatus Sungbacteria bacterium]